MNIKEQQVINLTGDIDYAPLTMQLSLEDRRTLANSLLKLGYKNTSNLLTYTEKRWEDAESKIKEKEPLLFTCSWVGSDIEYLRGYQKALEEIRKYIIGEEISE